MASVLPPLTLVLGGARSGKSAHAEALCRATGLTRVYVATAQAYDAEMRARIARHQQDRADHGWMTVEEEHDLAGVMAREAQPDRVLLIDCLTLWLSNRLLAEADCEAEINALGNALNTRTGSIVAVSNEVGLGIVPDNALARRFRDLQGRLNQRIAAIADTVHFVAAGLPMVLKGDLS